MSSDSEFATAMKRLAEANQRITDLEETVSTLSERVDELTKESGGRSEKIDHVFKHAARKQRNGEDVPLDYSDVMAAAGVSPPTAYDYMKTMATDHDGVKLLDQAASPSGKTRIVITGPRLRGLKHDDE